MDTEQYYICSKTLMTSKVETTRELIDKIFNNYPIENEKSRKLREYLLNNNYFSICSTENIIFIRNNEPIIIFIRHIIDNTPFQSEFILFISLNNHYFESKIDFYCSKTKEYTDKTCHEYIINQCEKLYKKILCTNFNKKLYSYTQKKSLTDISILTD
jgi:hypothetical protein